MHGQSCHAWAAMQCMGQPWDAWGVGSLTSGDLTDGTAELIACGSGDGHAGRGLRVGCEGCAGGRRRQRQRGGPSWGCWPPATAGGVAQPTPGSVLQGGIRGVCRWCRR